MVGWLLPLMTIVGTFQDYAIAKRHHTLGSDQEEDCYMQQHMLFQLDTYAKSVAEIERTNDVWDPHFTKVVIAYAEYFIQISRILFKGAWIPRKGAAKAPSTCTAVIIDAVAAANNLNRILDLDPDVSFIPSFLGVRILQNSLPLLYAVQRLRSKANTKILEACEVIIRAIDAYNSTMSHDCYVSPSGFDQSRLD